jgi:hypothetical protein
MLISNTVLPIPDSPCQDRHGAGLHAESTFDGIDGLIDQPLGPLAGRELLRK